MEEDDYKHLIQQATQYRSPDVSVVRFLNRLFWPRVEQVFLDRELNVLEVGCGISSLFADSGLAQMAYHRVKQVRSVDINSEAIDFMNTQTLPLGAQQVFECVDVTEVAWLHCFELAVDSSCFHCLYQKEDQVRYLNQLRRALVPGGLLFLQSMVLPKKLGLEEGHELDAHTGILTRHGKPWRRLVEAFEIEKMLKEAGLEIEFFKVSQNEKAVLSKERPIPMSSDPDILRVIARAPS